MLAIGLVSAALDQWGQMATDLLGMQQVDRGGSMRAFRMDDASSGSSSTAAATPA